MVPIVALLDLGIQGASKKLQTKYYWTGQDKLGLRSYDVVSQARTLSANERLREPEREKPE